MDKQQSGIAVIYFLISIPMYYFHSGGIKIGEISFLYCYILAIVFVLFTFFCFLIKPNIKRMVKVSSAVGILSMPYLFTMFNSLIIWIINLTSFRVMLRGLFQPVYQIIAICMAGCAVYFWGKRGVYFQLMALLAAYIVHFIRLIAQNGVGEFVQEYVALLITNGAETGVIMEEVEGMAYAHGTGFFLLYLIFTGKENPKNIIFFVPTLLFFLSGFKRSAMLGGAAALFFLFVCSRFPEKLRGKIVSLFSLGVVIAGSLYIWMLSQNIIEIIFDKLGINSMGRTEIYAAMRNYYEFSPAFIGRGLGFVSYSIGNQLIDVGNTSRGDIHNDLLRQYIESGMISYLIWLVLFFIWRIRKYHLKAGAKGSILVFSCLLYCFCCYLTENMYYRFSANLGMAAVILSYVIQQEEIIENEREEMVRSPNEIPAKIPF